MQQVAVSPPPMIETAPFSEASTTASITAFVPAWKLSHSKTPTGLKRSTETRSAGGKDVEIERIKEIDKPIPNDGLGSENCASEGDDALFTAIKSHPAIGDSTRLVRSVADVGVLVKGIGSDIIDGEMDLDAALVGFVEETLDDLCALLIKERVADLCGEKR